MVFNTVVLSLLVFALCPEPSVQQVFQTPLTIAPPAPNSPPYFYALITPGVTILSVVWSKDGQTITSGSKYVIQQQGTMLSLAILSPDANDVGNYAVTVNGASSSVNYGTSGPAIRLDLQDRRVNTGSPITLQVELTEPVSDPRWYRNNVLLTPTPNKYAMRVDNTLYYLDINNTQIADQGTYTFRGGNLESSMTLTVVAPQGVQIDQGLSDSIVSEGRSATFELRLSQTGITNGIWRQGNQVLTNTGRMQISTDGVFQRLVVNNVNRADQATTFSYEINGVNTVGRLNVVYIISQLQAQSVTVGQSVTFEVTLSLPGLTSGRWFNAATPLINDGNTVVSTDQTVQRLFIRNVQLSDDGTISYVYETVSSIARLTVLQQQTVSIVQGLTELTVGEGRSATFQVRLSQSGVTNGIWRQGSQVLTNTGRMQISTDGVFQRLVVTNVNRADQATTFSYEINGLNTVGRVNVVYVMSPLQSRSVQVGQSVTFEVTLSIPGLTSGRWFRDGTQLTNDGNTVISTSQGIQRLVIRSAQLSNNGVISYVYDTGVSSSASLTVTQQQAVSIAEGLTELTIAEGRSATFQVRLSQSGVTNGIWRQGSQVLTNTGRMQISTDGVFQRLVVNNVNRADQATTFSYEINGVNTVGRINVVYVMSPLQSRSVQVGQSVTFEVTLSIPSLTSGRWFNDANQLTNDGNTVISTSQGIQRLVIRSAQLSDDGVVSYVYDTGVSSSARLTVTQLPTVTIVSGLSEVTVAEGRSATFEVTLSQGNVRNGIWRQGTQVLTNTGRMQIVTLGTLQRLVVNNVQRNDAGAFSYQIGGDNTQGNLRVLYVVAPLQNVNVQAGGDATLETILSIGGLTGGSWTRSGNNVFPSFRIQIDTIQGIQRLVIRGAQSSDAGIYVYTHPLGVSTTAQLTVTNQVPVVNGQFGLWTTWTDPLCDNTCGLGVAKQSERTRQCDSPPPSNGGRNCIGDNRETRIKTCNLDPCPVPTQHLCTNVQRVDDVGYRNHLTDCDKYVQCYFNPNGQITGSIRSCEHGMYWDQTTLRCDKPENVQCPVEQCSGKCEPHYKHHGSCRSYWKCQKGKAMGSCCMRGFTYKVNQGCVPDFFCQDQCPPPCSSYGVCGKKPTWDGNIASYNYTVGTLGWTQASCGSGNYFDITECACSSLNTACVPAYDLRFSSPTDLAIARNTWLTDSNIEFQGGFAEFKLDSSFAANLRLTTATEASDVLVSFIYQEASNAIGRRVLLSTGNCMSGNSLIVAVDSGNLVFETYSRKRFTTVLPVSLNGFARTERKVVTFLYTGFDLTVSLASRNIRFTAKVNAPDVAVLECGLRLGSDGINNSQNFIGTMEQFTVYQCTPGNTI